MRIVSLDPGSANLGWSVIEVNPEGRFEVLRMQVAHPKIGKFETFNAKLNATLEWLVEFWQGVFDQYQPDQVIWEIVPSFGQMGSSGAVIACTTAFKVEVIRRGLPYTEYSANFWKKSLTGSHKSSKAQVKEAVVQVVEAQDLLSSGELDLRVGVDAFDSLAMSIVYLKDPKNQVGVKQ